MCQLCQSDVAGCEKYGRGGRCGGEFQGLEDEGGICGGGGTKAGHGRGAEGMPQGGAGV